MKKVTGTRFIVCIFIGVISLITTSHAAYIIDADLSDWNIAALGDWLPATTATSTQTNGTYSCQSDTDGEIGKCELFYCDEDKENLYIAVIGSYPLEPKVQGLDLDLDLNNGSSVCIDCPWIGPGLGSGISTEQIDCTTTNPIHLVKTDSTIDDAQSDKNQQDSLGQLSKDTSIGMAVVAIKGYPDLKYSTTIVIEIAIPKCVIPFLDKDSLVACHIDQYCGNEVENLNNIVTIPEPGVVTFISLGVMFLRMLGAGPVILRKKQ
jgi:hypothetical protein